MSERKNTPDYVRLEAEAQSDPRYIFGRRWQDADEKVQKLRDYLDSLYDSTDSIDWNRVLNMYRLNEYLDQALQLIGCAPEN